MSGAGALCAPFSATQFARLKHWSFQYFTSLGIACLSMISLIECLVQIGIPPKERSDSQVSHFRQIFSLSSVHLLTLFAFAYVGTEITLGGMNVSSVQPMVDHQRGM